jgi:Serine dehydrogenase proteinase
MSVGDIIWFFFMFTALQPVLRQRMLEAMRTRKIARLEKERNSRVMLLVHRQETMRFLGFPLARYIHINDSEEFLRANQVTDGEVPLDMWSLHSRRAGSGGAPDRASRLRPQIQASSRRTTPCRSTLVVLAADEIVMCKHSVLGGIDPQLGDTPAASLLKVVRTEARGGNRRSDLDPRGHRAGGDRSGQAGGNGTVAAHAPNRSVRGWRKTSQPGHAHMIIRFGA